MSRGLHGATRSGSAAGHDGNAEEGTGMAKGQLRKTKEAKKPKKEKPKVLATAGLNNASAPGRKK